MYPLTLGLIAQEIVRKNTRESNWDLVASSYGMRLTPSDTKELARLVREFKGTATEEDLTNF